MREIPQNVWNLKVHYRLHKSPPSPADPTQIQMNPVHALVTYFLKIHIITILPSTPRSRSFSLPSTKYISAGTKHNTKPYKAYRGQHRPRN
jgi:hypothetical protein